MSNTEKSDRPSGLKQGWSGPSSSLWTQPWKYEVYFLITCEHVHAAAGLNWLDYYLCLFGAGVIFKWRWTRMQMMCWSNFLINYLCTNCELDLLKLSSLNIFHSFLHKLESKATLQPVTKPFFKQCCSWCEWWCKWVLRCSLWSCMCWPRRTESN